jgi:hypothetical protein
MAARYNVASGNWSSTSIWSTTPGGGGGASVPTTGDDAYFDANSGNVALDIAATPDNIFLQASYTGTLTQGANPDVGTAIDVQGGTWATAAYNVVCGNLTVGAGGTWTSGGASVIAIDTGNLSVSSSATVTWASGRVIFTNTAAGQTCVFPTAVGSFYELQISNSHSSHVDLGSDIRVEDGGLIIDTDCTLDTLSTYDVYLRGGAWTPLTLNGILYGNGSDLIYEVDAAGTTYIAGSTGWNINGGLTGMSIWVQVIANVTCAIRMTADIRDVNNFQIETTSAGSSAVVSFYTDDYDIATKTGGVPDGGGVYSFMRIGPELAADAGTFTSYWGSSTIWTPQFIRWQWDAATHNMQTAYFRVATNWSVYGTTTDAVSTAQTFNVGTSSVRCAHVGESWMGLGAHDGIGDFYTLIADNPGSIAYWYIQVNVANQASQTDNGSTTETSIECRFTIDIEEMLLDSDYADVTFTLYETGQNYIRKKPAWDGLLFFRNRIRSRSPATQADLQIDESGGVVTRTDVQDSNLTGVTVDATDATNIDSGNNSWRWIFTAEDSFDTRGVGRGVARGVARGVS